MGILDDQNAYVDFLTKNKLSTNQFLLLYLLYTEQMIKSENSLKFKKVGNIYKWMTEGKGWSIGEIDDLIAKDYVFGIKSLHETPEGKKLSYSIDQLILTQKFSDLMFINANFAFEEILELYPDTFQIVKDGHTNTVFTKSGDLDKVQLNYSKLIKNNILKHEETKQIIIYAKERGLCNYKLENFLTKAVLDSIRKMMVNHIEKDINDGSKEL